MVQTRCTFTLNKTAVSVLEKYHKASGVDRSSIVETLIIKALQDPLDVAREKSKELWLAFQAARDEVERLEKIRGEVAEQQLEPKVQVRTK